MKPKPTVEARRWLDQATSDLAFAELGVREGYPAQACFMCQQGGERALKALRYVAGERLVRRRRPSRSPGRSSGAPRR